MTLSLLCKIAINFQSVSSMHTERYQHRMERVPVCFGGRSGTRYPDREQDDPRPEYSSLPGRQSRD